MRESATQTGTKALSGSISMRTRVRLAGIFILTAYFVLAYSVTDNPGIVFVFEVFSGLSVIGIALMLYPMFSQPLA